MKPRMAEEEKARKKSEAETKREDEETVKM